MHDGGFEGGGGGTIYRGEQGVHLQTGDVADFQPSEIPTTLEATETAESTGTE